MDTTTVSRERLVNFVLDVGYEAKRTNNKILLDMTKDFYDEVLVGVKQLNLFE